MKGPVIRILSLLATTMLLGGTEGRPAPPHVVIIVLDTVRASSLKLFTDQTPVLSGIARQGIVFENASSTWDYTPPSHHSIFTGYHGGMNTKYDLPQNSMAHHLKAMGYLTIGISANGAVSKKSMNICEPFEIYSDFFSEFEVRKEELLEERQTDLDRISVMFDITPNDFVVRNYLADADWVIDRLKEHLPEHPDRPVLLFLNFLDAHDPYLPPTDLYDPIDDPRRPEFFSDLRERPIPKLDELTSDPELRRKVGFRMMNFGADGRWKISLGLNDYALSIYRKRYEASIAHLDAKIGEVMGVLEDRGIFENAVIFITADHGESFGEDDLITHRFYNQGDFESSRHVPFIVIPPKKTLSGPLVISEPVSIADIKPTVYDLLGIDFQYLPGMEHGKSLIDYFEEYTVPPPVRIPLEFSTSKTDDKTKALQERLRSLGYHN